MHRLKYTRFSITIIAIFLTAGIGNLMAQSMEVHLDEVQITASRKNSYAGDLHHVRIDTVLKTRYFGSDLSQVLKNETNLNITQYGGQGSLASVRLRGSAPSQTQINWNGIPVNSPTTGSIDLSLLSAGMADAIDVAYGASGSLFGNGTFGGSINLYNTPDWDNRLSVNLAGETGSWNHFKTGLGLRTGNGSFQYHLTGLSQSSPNSYRYRNPFKKGSPFEYRVNDSMNLMAFQQHLFFRLPRNWFVQYGAWFHNREKMLPASMSSTPVYSAIQEDRSIRQFIRVTKWYRKSSVEIVGAFFTDSLLYSERQLKSDSITKQSGIRSSDSYLSVYHRWFINENLTLENGADVEYQSAKVEAYHGLAGELRSAAFSLLKFTIREFSANVSYRQVFYSANPPRPLFSAAFQYQMPVFNVALKGQVSNKFRLPTLNDRYWLPGGNPELLPESGMGYDLGFSWSNAGSVNSSLTVNSLIFMQTINNWIQWVPAGTFWSPQNIRQVKCQGLEADVTGRWKAGSTGLMVKAMYTYTESLDMSLPAAEKRFVRQLAYVPFHLAKIQGGITVKGFEASLAYKFTGRRFTTDNHDPWLDLSPYHLADLSVGYTFQTRKNRIIVAGNVCNLLDASYQLIRAYPAPGRSFYLSVNYLFNQKNQK